MSNTLEDLAVAIASASEIAVALKIPFEFKVDFPEIDISKVEPLEIYWGQLFGVTINFKAKSISLKVEVHEILWTVEVPFEFVSTISQVGLNYDYHRANRLPLDLRKLITTHILENS